MPAFFGSIWRHFTYPGLWNLLDLTPNARAFFPCTSSIYVFEFQPNFSHHNSLQPLTFNTSGLLMEFHHSQLGANRHRLADHGIGCEFTDEDDAFYAELRRQVLLLTTEEDEDSAVEAEAGCSSFHSAYKRGSNGLSNHFPTTLKPGSYFSWWEREKGDAVPTWLVDLWRTGKGTGVFIPQIVKSRRRYKHGRVENGRRRAYTCRQATIRQ